jgi:hypothetical protein
MAMRPNIINAPMVCSGYNYQIPGEWRISASSELSNGICIGNYFFDGTNWYKISDSFFPFLSRYNYSVSFNDYQNLINGEAFNSTTSKLFRSIWAIIVIIQNHLL